MLLFENSHPGDAILQRSGCYALAELCRNNRDFSEQVVKTGGISTICKAMRSFCERVELQFHACTALESLLHCCPLARVEGLQADCHWTLLNALRRYVKNEQLNFHAAGALHAFASESVLHKKELTTKDTLKIILRSARQWQSTGKLCDRFCSLIRILGQHKPCHPLMMSLHFHHFFLGCLGIHQYSTGVCQHALCGLAQLADANAERQLQIADPDQDFGKVSN